MLQSIEKKSEKYEREIQDLIRAVQKQDQEIQMLKSILTNPFVQKLNTLDNLLDETTLELNSSPEELDLLREYNSNLLKVPVSLRDRAANVTINEETFSRLQHGDESNIAFEPDRKGNYLVITRGEHRYLVPNKQRKISTTMYAVTKAVYKCDGYSESYKEFCLIKPALVFEESINCWKLSQQGTLEFI